jgi:hypothetical protein
MAMKELTLATGLALFASGASAVTLDFDTLGDCSGGPGVSFTIGAGVDCEVGPGWTGDGNTLYLDYLGTISDPVDVIVRADFSALVDSVSVTLGDYGQDADNIFLEIFDALDTSLGYVDLLRDTSSIAMNTLSLTGSGISYAMFGTNGYDLGFIAADNFTYEVAAVPLPAGGVLLLTALGGLALARRRKA